MQLNYDPNPETDPNILDMDPQNWLRKKNISKQILIFDQKYRRSALFSKNHRELDEGTDKER